MYFKNKNLILHLRLSQISKNYNSKYSIYFLSTSSSLTINKSLIIQYSNANVQRCLYFPLLIRSLIRSKTQMKKRKKRYIFLIPVKISHIASPRLISLARD